MKKFLKNILSSLALLAVIGTPLPVQALSTIPDHAYPRVANFYLDWTLNDTTAAELAKWDVVILDMEVQARRPDILEQLRRKNPDIVLLAYITPQEIQQNPQNSESIMRRRFAQGMYDDWYLTDSFGARLSRWPGTYILNVSNSSTEYNNQKYNDYFVDFVTNRILKTGYWDGIFLDNAWDNITYFVHTPDIDFDADNFPDTHPNATWQAGMKYIYQSLRQATGNKYLLVGNNDTTAYFEYLNGQTLENFPDNRWAFLSNRYKSFTESFTQKPLLNIINSNTANKGIADPDALRKYRLGLATTLLHDGYYSYDFGDTHHAQTWWFDEYSVDLGAPIHNPRGIFYGSDTYNSDVWIRYFEHGIVLVNSTDSVQTIKLSGKFKAIGDIGTQVVKAHEYYTNITLAPQDGLLIVK